MLTLATGSYCDVCSDEYDPQCLPHSIPCGHVLCANCCNNIIEKTVPRHPPSCPFCREHFTREDVRVIRTDFTTSGWTTPRRVPPSIETSLSQYAADIWTKKTEKLLHSQNANSRAKVLENKVMQVATKRCSVEEVAALQTELEAWTESHEQTPSIILSVALLRAILMNHVAHSEASKTAKSVETGLRNKLDDLGATNGKLDAECRRLQQLSQQKAQEVQSLRTELTRFKVVATTLGGSTSPPPMEPRHRPTSPPPPSQTPTPATTYSSTTTPLSRLSGMHMRSASMSASSRPSTPARSHTPSVRSHTPSPAVQRSPSVVHASHPRSNTPALPISPVRFPNTSSRSQTPGPPLVPPKPRRLSQPTVPPTPVVRSLSEEKHAVHERWLPPQVVDSKAGKLLRRMRSPEPTG